VVLEEIATGPCYAAIRDDQRLARQAGLRGTPTVFVNGIPIEGLPDEATLDAVIAAALAAAAGQPVGAFHATWWAAARDLQ
jgi:protein-disulfide isomerase